MKITFIPTKHKLPFKAHNIDEEVIWGSPLFVNAQIILQLITKISKYKAGKEDLKNIFTFANAVNEQQKVKLYKELQQEIDEICFLEKEMQKGEIKPQDKDIINFILNSILTTFTANIQRRNK